MRNVHKALLFSCFRPSGVAVAIIVSTFFLYEFFQMTMMTSIGIGVMTSLKLDSSQIAYVSAIYYLSLFIFTIPAGATIDRFPLKKIIVIIFLISIVGTVLLSLSTDLFEALIGRFLSGVGGGFAFLCYMKYLSCNVGQKYHNKLITIIIGIAYTIAFVSQYSLAIFVKDFGWRYALLLLSVVGIISLLLICACRIQNNAQTKEKVTLILPNRNTLLSALYSMVMNLSVITFGALWGIVFIINKYHFSYEASSFCVSIFYFGLLVGSLVLSKINGLVLNTIRIMKVYLCVLILSIAVMATNVSFNFYEGMVFLFIFGLISSAYSLGQVDIMKNNKPDNIAMASSIASIIIMGGGALIKVMQGFILHESGDAVYGKLIIPDYSPHTLNLAIGFLGVIAVVVLFLFHFFYDSASS